LIINGDMVVMDDNDNDDQHGVGATLVVARAVRNDKQCMSMIRIVGPSRADTPVCPYALNFDVSVASSMITSISRH
jgi:hypothetical protein